jgi:hypothetical protein
MALAYFGDKLSDHLTKTTEGFLICHNVPIARTGKQSYYGKELGIADEQTSRFEVERPEDVVFAPETLASFEGKPVTDGHPPSNVTPQTSGAYAKGHVQNVRRGSGEHHDKIVADLFIDDEILINQIINNQKREVSCGYTAKWLRHGTDIQQTSIEGNHVAVVPAGRAGAAVAIRDESTDTTLEDSKISYSQIIQRSKRMEGQETRSPIKSIINLMVSGANNAKSAEDVQLIADAGEEALTGLAIADAAPTSPVVEEKEVVTLDAVLSAVTQLSEQVGVLGERLNAVETQDAAVVTVDEDAKAAEVKVEEKAEPVEDAKADDEESKEEKAEEKEDEKEEEAEEPTEDAEPDEASEEESEADTEDAAIDEDPDQLDYSQLIGDEDPDEGEELTGDAVTDAALEVLAYAQPAIAAIEDDNLRAAVLDALYDKLGTEEEDVTASLLDAAMGSTFTPDEAQSIQSAYDKFNPHLG